MEIGHRSDGVNVYEADGLPRVLVETWTDRGVWEQSVIEDALEQALITVRTPIDEADTRVPATDYGT